MADSPALRKEFHAHDIFAPREHDCCRLQTKQRKTTKRIKAQRPMGRKRRTMPQAGAGTPNLPLCVLCAHAQHSQLLWTPGVPRCCFCFDVKHSYTLLSGPSPAWCLVFFMSLPACHAPVRCRKLGATVQSSCTLQLGVVPIRGSVPPLERENSTRGGRASRSAFLILIVAPT